MAQTLALSILLAFGSEPQGVSAEDVPPLYPVEAFAHMPDMMSPKLSPNGSFVAYMTSIIDGRKSVIAHPVTGIEKGKTMILPHIKSADVSHFFWANDEVLLVVYSFYGTNVFYRGLRVEQSRLVAASLKDGAYNLVKASKEQKRKFGGSQIGRAPKTAFAASQGNIIDLLPGDRDHILLAIDSNMTGKVGVRKIDVRTGDFTVVQRGRADIYNWLTDGDHEVALGYSTYDTKPTLYIAKKHRSTWSYEAIYDLLRQDITPIQIDDGNKTAVFAVTNEYGRKSLGRFDLATGDLTEWIYSNPLYDVADLHISSSTGRIIGTTYQDTMLRQVFFKKKEKKVLASVNAAMPGTTNTLFGSDRNGDLWMVRSSKVGAVDAIYSLDWNSKRMNFFSATHNQIKDKHVAPVTMHKVTMRDGLEIEVYVTTPIGRGDSSLPTVLLPHGGPWARDSAGFDSWAQLFANRGYLVLQPNFRGSTGYGQAFEDMGIGQWGKAMQDDLTDTVTWAVGKGMTNPKRVCIVGGSYGGYAAMMGVVKTPEQFQCAISINGVIDLPLLWSDDRDFLFYKRFREKLGENRSDLKSISPYHRAEEITKPVLLIAAKDDWRVNYKHSKKTYRKLKKLKKPVEYLELKTGGHGIDVNANRLKWFKAMDQFLAKHLGGEAVAR
ncbi:MAG: alpha/beta fold hydrolase [Pseudomonadota bacterium]